MRERERFTETQPTDDKKKEYVLMITIGMIIISLLRTYKLCCSLRAKSNCMNRDTHLKVQRRIFKEICWMDWSKI